MAPDDGGCGLYRLREPARVLFKQGVDIQMIDKETEWRVMDPQDGSDPVWVSDPPEADVVVLQRVMRDWRVVMIRALQSVGIAVVVDMDDDMHALHRSHPSVRDAHPNWHQVQDVHTKEITWRWDTSRRAPLGSHHLAEACDRADMVTVTTGALANRYGRHGRVTVLPNCVPAWYLDVEAAPVHWDRPTVGWSGIVATHPGDLQTTRGAVGQMAAETGCAVHVIGNAQGVQAALRLRDEPSEAPWCPLGEYPEALARLDVGIVPLEDSPFNAAKSRLKGIEMAAVGVPFVASPRSDYRELAKLGIGELAGTRSDWYRKVKRLVTDRPYRMHQADSYREQAAQLTYERHADRWLAAWQQAVLNRTMRSAAA